ncbi:hypothetical protein GCM10022295_62520 [Streptomyces osmaniensis]|uniref:Transposase IS110-like N-terminal domain-containing protein n=1 Tax=Streptomyces osmaniensis TaxID=593134 RepID=A0ABP6XU45_9ACTN
MVINARGEILLSRRILNGETELPALIADVLALSEDVLWAVDLNHGGAALLIGLLGTHGQPVRLPSAKPFPQPDDHGRACSDVRCGQRQQVIVLVGHLPTP